MLVAAAGAAAGGTQPAGKPLPLPRFTAPLPPAAAAAEYLVLTVPAGRFTITERLIIKRPWLVLRGAGSRKTTLYFPYSAAAAAFSAAALWLMHRGCCSMAAV